jgi:signal transduction histidine kinase
MRRRILLLVVGMTTLVVLAFAVPLALLIRHVVYQDAVNATSDEANRVANYLRSNIVPPTAADISAYLQEYRSSKRSTSVLLPSGAGSLGVAPPDDHDLPAVTPLDARAPDATRNGPPQATAISWHGGKLVQLPVLTGPQGDRDGDHSPQFVVRVFASDDQLNSGETGWLLLLVGVSIGLLALGAVLGELLTRRIIRPLTYTAQTAHQLSVGDTAARAPTDGPREVAEVGSALNRLADRIDQLIAEERETVADLSHRLRTPLTALRLDAEALRDPAEAERVGQHVSTVERTLTAVIHAARRPQREGRLPSCDATEVVAARVAFWSALADDQNRQLSVELPAEPLLVRAGSDDLAAAVDALLENVFAHTPEGTPFSVALVRTDTGARLTIADTGPGIPSHALLRGRSDRGSTGLGLDIARRSAEAAGGALHVASGPSGGAVVTLELAAP